MTDFKNGEKGDDEPPPQRRRARIYGERRSVSLRMEYELHERMMDLCNEIKIPANTYISELIRRDLRKRGK